MKKKENRGGARDGAGRPPKPPKEYSDYFKRGIVRSLKKKEKETGQSVFDIYADMLYSKHTQVAVKASLIKLYSDVMVEKVSKSVTEINDNRQIVILPATQEKPILAAEGDIETHKIKGGEY